VIRHRTTLLGIALAVATFTVYAQVFDHAFLNYDDPDYVTANRHVLAGVTRDGLTWTLTATHASNWHPVTWLSHMVDCQLHGTNAGGHLLTNVVLHVANTLLLFALLARLTGAAGRSAFVAVLFALHPLHVESVAWVAERKDVLSTTFAMLTLWSYVRFVESPRARTYLPMILLYGLGLMTKPMLVTLPFVLLLLDYWPLRRMASRPLRALIVEKLPLFVLAALSSAVTMVVQRAEALSSLTALPFSRRISHAVTSYVGYLARAFWPADLAVFYPYPPALPLGEVLAAAVLLVGVTVTVLRMARAYPYLPVGWLWYLGTLVPVIGIVQAGLHSMADRHTYVPLIGIFIIVAWGVPDLLARVPRRQAVLAIGACAVSAACALITWRQLGHWHDSGTLFEHALAVTTDNFVAHNNLGEERMRQGRVREASEHFREAVRLEPRFALAHVNLGGALFSDGRIEEAIAQHAEALRLSPDDADAHYNLGVALYRLETSTARSSISPRPYVSMATIPLRTTISAPRSPDEAEQTRRSLTTPRRCGSTPSTRRRGRTWPRRGTDETGPRRDHAPTVCPAWHQCTTPREFVAACSGARACAMQLRHFVACDTACAVPKTPQPCHSTPLLGRASRC